MQKARKRTVPKLAQGELKDDFFWGDRCFFNNIYYSGLTSDASEKVG